MSLPFGPSNVTCLLAVSTATILPWTVRTVSAAIPPSGAALGGAAVSAGMLAGGGLCVLPHPAATIASAANNENWSIARFFMSSFPRARVFPRLFVSGKPRNQNRQHCLSPEPPALLVIRLSGKDLGQLLAPLVILTKRATRHCCHPDEASDASLLVILPSARVARFVRMTQKIPALAFARMTEKDARACRANDESGGRISLPANRHTGRRTVSASGRRATRVLRLRRYRRARSTVRGCARLRRETLAAARLRA